jgi:8-oxo-dGTP pyrophosphatase MutT (NUDIX family)
MKPLFKTRYYSSVILQNDKGDIYLSKRLDQSKPMYGYLQCPGGQLNGNETFLEAAKRETQEEAGIIIDESRLKQEDFKITNSHRSKNIRDIFAYTPYQNSEWFTRRSVQPYVYTLTKQEEELLIQYQEHNLVSQWELYDATKIITQIVKKNQPTITAVRLYIKDHLAEWLNDSENTHSIENNPNLHPEEQNSLEIPNDVEL